MLLWYAASAAEARYRQIRQTIQYRKRALKTANFPLVAIYGHRQYPLPPPPPCCTWGDSIWSVETAQGRGAGKVGNGLGGGGGEGTPSFWRGGGSGYPLPPCEHWRACGRKKILGPRKQQDCLFGPYFSKLYAPQAKILKFGVCKGPKNTIKVHICPFRDPGGAREGRKRGR